MPRSTPPAGPWILRWLVAAFAGSVLLDITSSSSVIAGDPKLYLQRADSLAWDHLPYVSAPFEHLPALIPFVLLVRLLGALTSGANPALLFAPVMLVVVGMTSVVIDRIGRHLDRPVLGRWVITVTPLLPIVMFRLDAVPVLFATLAAAALVEDRARATAGWAALGVAAKGWPVAFAPALWWRGRRGLAVALAAGTVVLMALLAATPGFREGRAYEGVHTETIVGSSLLLARNLRGADLGLIEAAWSLYIAAPGWAGPVQLVLGATVAILAVLRVARRPYQRIDALALVGAFTAAAITASPLLSGQFVYWLAPFVTVAATARTRILFGVTATIGTVLLVVWHLDSAWWSALALMRGIGVMAVGVSLVFDIGTRADRPQLATVHPRDTESEHGVPAPAAVG